MRAYSEAYLSGAQQRLGAMLDAAVFGLGLGLDFFYEAFLASNVSARFERGEPSVVAGRSGEELAFDVARRAGVVDQLPERWRPSAEATDVYWTGWALAFYQWASASSFAAIQEAVPIVHVAELYHPYHEMDVRQFCDRMDQLIDSARPSTNLKERRMAAGLSQSQLAEASGVPVRTLQQYEQRQKDINRARADYVDALARALSCTSADLLERRARAHVEYALVGLS